jgi:non-specific serine/threonine protein kinase
VSIDTSLLLAATLWRFWLRRGQLFEGRRMLELALAHDSAASPRARASALHAFARLTCEIGNYQQAITPAVDSLRIFRAAQDQRGVSSVLMILGYIDTRQLRYEQATVRLDEALAIDRAIGNDIGMIEDLNTLALIASNEGSHDQAETLYAEVVRLLRRRGDRFSLANALNNMGTEAWMRGDFDGATTMLEESLELARGLQYSAMAAIRLVNLGHVALDQGKPVLAAGRYRDALRLDEPEQKVLLVEALEGFAAVAGAVSQPLAAARLFGAAEALRDEMNYSIPPSEQLRYERLVAAARSTISGEAWASAWAEGRATPTTVIVEEILST